MSKLWLDQPLVRPVDSGVAESRPVVETMTLDAWWAALGDPSFGMLLLDAQGCIHSTNAPARDLLGDLSVAGRWPDPATRFYSPDGRVLDETENPMARAFATGAAVYHTMMGIDRSEGRQWLVVDVRPLLGQALEVIGMVVCVSRRPSILLEDQDGLTGLPARGAMRTRLNQILAAGTPVALLVLGLDHFKEVNFSFGYQLGNRLLARVADRLGRMLAPEQQLARLDGDLFALVLPGVADQQAAMAVARRALRTLELPVSIDTESLTIGASIGVAFGPADGADADALLRCADVALDHAKQRHSGIEVFRATNDPFKPERLRLLSELPFAIEARQTFLCYQPKEDLVTGHIMGLEALVRWRHPTAGIVPPDEFIGYAEQRGLIGALTVAVLDEATHQIATWSRLGLNVPVAVNLSARSLHDPLLPDTICGLCETAGVPTSMLELEITESTVMADPNRAHDLLERLRERGILHIALDDFGTGYSSLAVLRKLPVNTLKLDRSFIKEMRSDPAAVAIVEAMVDLAHKLDKVVVAEGVEDDITRSLLRQIGCDQIQGYFLCKPLPAPDITQWLGRRQ